MLINIMCNFIKKCFAHDTVIKDSKNIFKINIVEAHFVLSQITLFHYLEEFYDKVICIFELLL